MFNFLLSFFSRWFKISQYNDGTDPDNRHSVFLPVAMGGSCRKSKTKKNKNEEKQKPKKNKKNIKKM